jgi:hypothetical protein
MLRQRSQMRHSLLPYLAAIALLQLRLKSQAIMVRQLVDTSMNASLLMVVML